MSTLQNAIYMDHHASAPLCEAAKSVIERWLRSGPGNPSSIHGSGQHARHALDLARRQVAAAVGAAPRQVLFTSGATEANHSALRGLIGEAVGVIWMSAGAHASAHTAANRLVEDAPGWQLRTLGLTPHGVVDMEAVAHELSREAGAPDACHIVSLSLVNSELGTIQPVAAVAAAFRAVHDHVIVHCDATQALGRIAVDRADLAADLLTLSGHKIGTPAGIGALITRDGLVLHPLTPGPQEDGRRAGTENLVGAMTLGAACAALPERRAAMAKVREQRDALWAGIEALAWPTRRHAADADETGTCLSVAFLGCEASDLVMSLDMEGVAVSAGAACSSGTVDASPVISAIVDDSEVDVALATVRFSLGPETVAPDIQGTLTALRCVLSRMQAPDSL